MSKLISVAAALVAVAAFASTATAGKATAHAASAGKKRVTAGFYRGRTISYFDF